MVGGVDDEQVLAGPVDGSGDDAELVERHRAEAMLPRHSAEQLSVERS